MKKLDEVYMLIKEDQGIWYSPPATSTTECWEKAYQWELILFKELTTQEPYEKFRNRMIKDGWKARKIVISI